MMKLDNNAQISMEYLIIFAVGLIILIAFTLPLAQMGIEKTLDVSDSLNAKSELSKLSGAISQVYAQGQGSKQTMHLTLDEAITVKITNSYISTSFRLNDGETKSIKLNHNSNLGSGSLFLDKGENTVVVEWPVDRENMVIYKTY